MARKSKERQQPEKSEGGPCFSCRGEGRIWDHVCPSCKGTGRKYDAGTGPLSLGLTAFLTHQRASQPPAPGQLVAYEVGPARDGRSKAVNLRSLNKR
jgi:hypothetical protein